MGYRKSDDIDRHHGFAGDAPATRSKMLTIRIDADLHRRLLEAAAVEDRTLSAFFRAAAMQRADHTLMIGRRRPPGARMR